MTDDREVRETRVTERAKGELARARDIRLGMAGSVVAGLFIGWAAIALKALLNEALGEESGYVLLVAGAVVAAWFGGLVGGITAVIVAVVLNGIVFLGGAPDEAARINATRQVLFVLVATGTVLLVATRRAATDRLADALDEVATLVEEVAARDARLELMLAASGTGFWEWDIETGALTWSEAIFEQHGLDPSNEAPDFATYLGRIHPDDRAMFQDAIAKAIDASDQFGLDFRLLWPDGSIHWTHGAGRVFRDADGNAVRMIGTGQDITERHRLEEEHDELLAEERRAGEFREAFVDVISHELRTPITTILGLTQILARPGRIDDPAARAAMLEDVRAESERLHRLVEDLLVLSRVERGRLDVDAEPLQPNRLLTRVIAQEALELPSIDITLADDPDLPVVVGEATYVEQILRNLLGNAAKYTARGTAVTVDARLEDGAVAIRVRDDGPGIPEASRRRIFELFYRDPDSARSVAGSGIGLFVCASLVEAMGGRIWVTEAPGGGAEFGFTLRVIDLDDGDATHPSTAQRTAVPAGTSGTSPGAGPVAESVGASPEPPPGG